MVTPEMMSFVGCSGEEFQAILRNLDFRMQKRKVKKPVVAPAPAEPVSVPVPVEAAVEEAVSPPAPAIEPALEEVERDVWWPKDTGPLHGRVRVLKVLGFSHRRGPAPEAELLYQDLSAAQKHVPKP